MPADLSEEEKDILTAIMEGGDTSSIDKKSVSLNFLSQNTEMEESKLKPILKNLKKDGYIEHRFFSDNTDDYKIRDKGIEVLKNL